VRKGKGKEGKGVVRERGDRSGEGNDSHP